MNDLTRRLGLRVPIIQAPMAGVSTPEMAAAVSDAGGLGSLGVGNLGAEAARGMIRAVRALSDRPFNVNVFCHPPAIPDPEREAAWLSRLEPHFARYGARPAAGLREIYTSFLVDDAMLDVLVAERPSVVSLHFGLPDAGRIRALKAAGIALLATATNLAEALAAEAAGVDAVVAQGFEAGGHRGTFDPDAPDDCLGTMALTRLLVRNLSVPVVAAGGIMDGAGIAAVLALGASAAQLGTAFLLCPESAADEGYRRAMQERPARRTVVTRAISGRPARSLANRFTDLGDLAPPGDVPSYPIAYDAGKALHAAAKAVGEFGYGAHWAGQGAAVARSMPAGELVGVLWRECREALAAEIRRASAASGPVTGRDGGRALSEARGADPNHAHHRVLVSVRLPWQGRDAATQRGGRRTMSDRHPVMSPPAPLPETVLGGDVPMPPLPPLVEGQRMDQAAFHARYEAMPPGTRAELINGVVYMPSPVGPAHGRASVPVIVWLDDYAEKTPGLEVMDNASTMLGPKSEPQPDALLRILTEFGGRTRSERRYLHGAPEMVAEVSHATRYVDLGPKLEDYQRAGVLEYVVRALEPDEIYWYVREGEELVPRPLGEDGLYRSVHFPGLWLDPQALIQGDRQRLRAIVDPGCATPEHAEFVARLADARDRAQGR